VGYTLHGRFLMIESKKPLTIPLAGPCGFCAGVDRAIAFSAPGVPPRQLVA
jgi:hypothetical protein